MFALQIVFVLKKMHIRFFFLAMELFLFMSKHYLQLVDAPYIG